MKVGDELIIRILMCTSSNILFVLEDSVIVQKIVTITITSMSINIKGVWQLLYSGVVGGRITYK